MKRRSSPSTTRIVGWIGAALVTTTLIVGGTPASAETPAERCKREASAYNEAWKATWTQANPGKSRNEAPPPPVPHTCRGGNDDPDSTTKNHHSDAYRVYTAADGCGDGRHRNNYGLGKCFDDYDYNVTDISFVRRGDGPQPIIACDYGVKNCGPGKNRTTRSIKSWEASGSSLGGTSLSGPAKSSIESGVNSALSAKYGHSLDESVTYDSRMRLDTGNLEPGQTVLGYPLYNSYDVTVEKYNTQTRRVESTDNYVVMVPIDGIGTRTIRTE